MQYRKLGKTGLSVSEIGYGGGRIKKDQGRKELIDLIHKALDQGINYIDTAPTYGDGFSETTLMEAFASFSDSTFVQTAATLSCCNNSSIGMTIYDNIRYFI